MSSNRAYWISGVLMSVLGAILYSSKAVFVKLAYQYQIDSISLLTLRMLFAIPFYIGILIWIHKKDPMNHSWKNRSILRTILLGISGFYIASQLDFIGLQYISAGIERIVLFTYPSIVVIIMAMFYKEKITPLILLALGFTYLGIFIAFQDKVVLAESTALFKGSVLVFTAASFYSIYVVGSGQLVKNLGTFRFTSIGMLAAAICILIQHGIQFQWKLFHFDKMIYLISLIIATVSTVIPSFLVMEGIKRIGSTNASIVGSIGPISTIILAYLILNEQFGYLQLLGTFVVIIGVLLIT
ncbi:MAG: DMT family transporter, partial [Bacteroidota bacterium]